MIRCVRIWTREDGNSLFEEGSIDLTPGKRGDAVGKPVPAAEISFKRRARAARTNGIWIRPRAS